jgi:PAS domain S-box-containing protein
MSSVDADDPILTDNTVDFENVSLGTGEVGGGTNRTQSRTARGTADHWQRVLAQTPFLLTRCSTDLRYLFVSDAYARMLGRRADEIIGKPIVDIIGEEAFKTILPYIQQVLRGNTVEYESTIKYRGIDPRFVRVVYTPDRDELGNIKGWIASIIDLSDRVNADHARKQLASIVDSSNDAIISKDLNGVIVRWNKAAERIFGYTALETIGRPITIIVPPELLDEERDILERIRRGECIEHYETKRRQKDGFLLNVSLTISPLKEANGQIVGASKIARDITDQVRAMTLLREVGSLCVNKGADLHSCLNRILEVAVEIIGAPKGNLQVFDPKYDHLTIAAQVGFGQPFLKFFKHVRDDSSACSKAIRLGKQVIVEDVLTSEIFIGHPSQKMLTDEGIRSVISTPLTGSTKNLLGVISTHFPHPHRPTEHSLRLLDLLARQAGNYLERKRAEDSEAALLRELRATASEAERANAVKSRFLAATSHDLRQPLQAATLYLSLLNRQAKTPEQRELCTNIQAPLQVMTGILDALLDISMLDSGSIVPKRSDFALSSILERVAVDLRPLAQQKNLQFDYLETDAVVNSDPALLERIVENLASNAIRYTMEGSVAIRVERIEDDVRISVIDTGVGIPDESLGKIFDEYFQFDNSARNIKEGLGLGLAIVKRLARLLNHPIHVHSALGRGSSFSVDVPLAAVAPQTEKLVLSSAEAHGALAVLFIDDDRSAADSLSRLFAASGIEAARAGNGNEALARLEGGFRPDVVLSDFRLPGENGFDVVERLRGALGYTIPVVLMTGDTSLVHTEPQKVANLTVVQKPVDGDALIALVQNLAVRPM